MSSCVCAKCKKPWKMSSSPAVCPMCNQVSFAIVIPEESAAIKKRGQDPEHRAKLSAARKAAWQDPEYRTKISAGMKRLWQDPEYQAKMGAIRKKRWQDPEYQAKMRAARIRGKEVSYS
ncbi:hypothetical protein ES703_14493 [subsurface metagenome]